MQLYSTGANRIWVKFPDENHPVSFCTCERAPRIRRIRGWENILADEGGSVISTDLVYLGQEIMVSGVANRFRWPVLSRLQKAPDYFQPAGGGQNDRDPGADEAGTIFGTDADLGTMVVRERMLLTVYIEFPIANNPLLNRPVFTAGGMPRGYRLPGAIFMGPDEDSGGTSAFKTQFLFLGKRVKNVTNGEWRAWDHNMSDLQGQVWDSNAQNV